MRVSWAAASHPGLQRPTNEDSYCARPDLGLFVVADGMGGHAAGEVASQTAVETIATVIHETAAADEHPAWPVPPDPGLSVGRQPAQGRLRDREPPNRRSGDRGCPVERHGHDGLRGSTERGASRPGACRRQPGVPAPSGAPGAPDLRPLVGRGAGAGRGPERGHGPPAPVAQRRDTGALGRGRPRGERRRGDAGGRRPFSFSARTGSWRSSETRGSSGSWGWPIRSSRCATRWSTRRIVEAVRTT